MRCTLYTLAQTRTLMSKENRILRSSTCNVRKYTYKAQFAHSRCERGNIGRKLSQKKCNSLQFIIWCFLSLTSFSKLKRYKKNSCEVHLWIDIFEWIGEFMLWFMTLFSGKEKKLTQFEVPAAKFVQGLGWFFWVCG